MVEKTVVAIIGSGIVGTAAAYYLAKRGVPVTVCEKGEVGGEQSSRAWGFVRQQGRDPAEMLLMVEAIQLWQGLERELEADLEWVQDGNLVTAEGPEQLARYEGWLSVAREFGLDSRILTKVEIGDLIQGLHLDCTGGLYTQTDGHAEPTKVTAAFRRAAERLGAEFRTGCAVRSITLQARRVLRVVTEQGEITAQAVLCAAGAWSSRLLRLLGLGFPQIWVRSSVARTAPVKAVTPIATWAGVAFRQGRGGCLVLSSRHLDHVLTLDSLLGFGSFLRRYLGHKRSIRLRLGRPFVDHFPERLSGAGLAKEFESIRVLDPPPNGGELEKAVTALRTTLPNIGPITIQRRWAGQIGMTPDFLPVIDRLDRPSGLLLATGFNGHGFGMGPMAGRLVSELILDGDTSHDLSAFRFDRFRDGTKLKPHNVV